MIKIHPPHTVAVSQTIIRRGVAELEVIYRAKLKRTEFRSCSIPARRFFTGARNRCYGDPIYVDDVAVDFPEDENSARSRRPPAVDAHRVLPAPGRHPNVYLDISGIPPKSLLKYFPRLEEIAHKTLFGIIDWPGPEFLTSNRISMIFCALPLKEETQAADSKQDRAEHLAGLVAARYLMNSHSGAVVATPAFVITCFAAATSFKCRSSECTRRRLAVVVDTVARDSVSVSIEPTISAPKYPIETWQTADRIERPCPPDLPSHIEVCVGARFQFAGAGQHSYVVQQILRGNSQAAVGRSGLQVLKREAPLRNYLLPEVNPTKTEPASAIVKYPARARQNRFRFMVWRFHRTLLPLKTMTWRAIRHERAIRASLQNVGEIIPIKSAGVSFKSSVSGCPHLPWGVRNVIFDGTAASLSRVTPVVFGDELFQTPLLRIRWQTHSLSREPAPLLAKLPLILGCPTHTFCFNAVPHRKVFIVLPVYDASGGCNCAHRNHLGNKHNSSSILITTFFAANVES